MQIPLVHDHPRLLIQPSQLAAFRRASLGHRRRTRTQLLRGLEPALASPAALRANIRHHPERLALALGQAWQMTRDERYGEAAHWLLGSFEFSAASQPTGYDTWGVQAEAAGMLYDWLHDFWRQHGLLRKCAYITAFCAQRALDDSRRLYILEDWHNFQLGLQSGALAAALALGDEFPDCEDGSVLRTLYRLHFTGLPSTGIYVQDGFTMPPTVHCLQDALAGAAGMGFAMHAEAIGPYHQVDGFEAVKIAELWTSALQPSFRKGRPIWPELERFGDSVLHFTRPDGRNAVLGDSWPKAPSHWAINALLHLQARARRLDFGRFIREHGDADGDPHPVHRLLRSLPRSARLRRSTIPASALIDPVAILRAGRGPDATMVTFRCGRYGGGHNHLDSNSFTIFRGGALAIDSGGVDYGGRNRTEYHTRTLAHNAILVHDPAERHWIGKHGQPTANDGGQRLINVTYGPPNPATGDPHGIITEARRTSHRDEFDTGTYLAFKAGRDLDYLAGDATRAYTSPWSGLGDNPSRRVEEAVRQLVFLKPDLIVVFDRVEASRAHFRKTWVLHTMGPPRQTGRKRLDAGIHALTGDVFEFAHERGRLTVWPLLPGERRVRAVGGAGYESWVDDPAGGGVNQAASKPQLESGAWRIEVEPLQPGRRHCFLTVLHAGLLSEPRIAPCLRCHVSDAGGRVRLVIERKGDTGWSEHAVLSFSTCDAVEVQVEEHGTTFADRAPAPRRVGSAADDAGVPASGRRVPRAATRRGTRAIRSG